MGVHNGPHASGERKAEEFVDLDQQLTDAMRRVREGLLKNEAQVKQSVILPILRALGWNTDAPEQLSAEFRQATDA